LDDNKEGKERRGKSYSKRGKRGGLLAYSTKIPPGSYIKKR